MDNRSKILHTALQLFATHSYEGIGIQQIALAAELTKPTLYHYFGSKQGLMEAVLREWGEPFLGRIRQAAGYSGDVMVTLKQLAEVQRDYAVAHESFYRMLKAMYTMPHGSPSYRMAAPYLEEEFKIIEELFRQIAADHGNIREKYPVFAATFMGMITTYIDLFLRESTQSRESLLHLVVHQYMHGIFS